MKRKASAVILSLLLTSLFIFTVSVRYASAQETIYIRTDGSIDPPTAPISTVDNVTYTFTGDISDQIVNERDNIIVDGNGFTLNGSGSGIGFDSYSYGNVTCTNMIVSGFEEGILATDTIVTSTIANNTYGISGASVVLDSNIVNNTYGVYNYGSEWWYLSVHVSGNNITENGWGIFMSASNILMSQIVDNYVARNEVGIDLYATDRCESLKIRYNNVTENGVGFRLRNGRSCYVEGNSITRNQLGIYAYDWDGFTENNVSENNGGILLEGTLEYVEIYYNNFIDNSDYDLNDNGSGAYIDLNYWSSYGGNDFFHGRYQNESGSDEFGDTPYIFDPVCIDHLPLMIPYGSPDPPTYWFNVTSTSGGTTYPPPSDYLLHQGPRGAIQALPNDGCTFKYWELDGARSSSDNPLNITVDGDHSLLAVFDPYVHDVAVTNMALSKTAVSENGSVTVNVTVRNQGGATEQNLSVALSANGTPLQNFTISSIASDAEVTFTFLWNTTGFARGSYNLTASVSPVEYETDMADNVFTGRMLQIVLRADINDDGYCNAKDAIKLGAAFGSTPESPNWNVKADLNEDGIINAKDAVLLGTQFGEHY